MQNSNENRYFKKDGRTVDEKYIVKHQDEGKKKIFSKFYVFFLIILALAVMVFNIYNHSYLKIGDIYISGNHKVTDTEIISMLGNPIGKNILTYKPADYEEGIKTLAYIDDVSIKRVYPNLLNVRVDENYPLYYQEKDGATYYISNKGILLDPDIELTEDMKLREIKGANLKSNVGDNFTGSDASMKFVTAIQDFAYFSGLKELNLENKADIGIIIDDIDVRFGDLNNIDYKLKLLDNILNDIDQKGITVHEIDLDNGNNPVVVVDKESFSDNLNY